MKKLTAAVMACSMMLMGIPAMGESVATPTVVKLEAGAVQVYSFGECRLHAYVTGDPLGDICYAVEGPEGIVLIESTAFTENIMAWKAYIDGLNMKVAGKLIAFHPNGADVYSEDKPYTTENALSNWGEGGSIRALTDGFLTIFGDIIQADHPTDGQLVNFGDMINIAGIEFIIRNEGDAAFGIEIPSINCIYIHMMGADSHNILTSTAHIDAFKAELEGFDYALVLSSHHEPEGMDAVKAKIAYLTKTRELAESETDAASFMAAMSEAFPDYAGANYLEMTAGFLFPSAE